MVGKAIRESEVPREDIIVASKLPGRHHQYDQARVTIEESVARMGLDYIDLYLIHWPNPSQGQSVEAWQALVDAHHALWGTERIGADEKAMSTRTGRPLTDKWTFSTNGVSIQGRYGIPCVGFGPGAESQAHAPNEITWKQDLVTCAALYAAVPGLYLSLIHI